MMTCILSNLPEEYQTIVEIIEEKIDYENNPITTEKIRDKLLIKY